MEKKVSCYPKMKSIYLKGIVAYEAEKIQGVTKMYYPKLKSLALACNFGLEAINKNIICYKNAPKIYTSTGLAYTIYFVNTIYINNYEK